MKNAAVQLRELCSDDEEDIIASVILPSIKHKLNIKAKPFKPGYLKWGWVPLHTTIYVKKEVFRDYGLYEEQYRIASDYEITLRWLSNPQLKTHFINDWLVKMRLGGKSTTPALQKKKSKEDLAIIKKYPLWGVITLAFKIGRKIPQYILPRIQKFD